MCRAEGQHLNINYIQQTFSLHIMDRASICRWQHVGVSEGGAKRLVRFHDDVVLLAKSSDAFVAGGGDGLRMLGGRGGGLGGGLRHEVNVERPSRKMEECGETLGRATSAPLFPGSSTCLTTSFLFITRQQSSS